MCRNEPVRDPGLPDGAAPVHSDRVCDSTGNMPFCQLCPASSTYWRNTAQPAAADPWNGAGTPPPLDMSGWREDLEPLPDGDYAYALAKGEAMRCVLCKIPTTWISPKGNRCHPECATMWARKHTVTTTSEER